MPQLDKFAISSQVFWLILVFLGFYFIFFNFILPQMYVTLRIRNTRFVKLWNKMNAYADKKVAVVQYYNNFFKLFFNLQSNFANQVHTDVLQQKLSVFEIISKSQSFRAIQAHYLKLALYGAFILNVVKRKI
jgi:hypothetical protein